jgi:hypothetical protein
MRNKHSESGFVKLWGALDYLKTDDSCQKPSSKRKDFSVVEESHGFAMFSGLQRWHPVLFGDENQSD